MIRPILLLLFLSFPVFAQTTQEKVRDYRRLNERRLLSEYTEFLAIPNVASDIQNIRRNAAHIMDMMKRRSLSPRLLEAETPNVPPAVYAEWKTPGAQRTLLFYAHYDGQPTDPKQWTESCPGSRSIAMGQSKKAGRSYLCQLLVLSTQGTASTPVPLPMTKLESWQYSPHSQPSRKKASRSMRTSSFSSRAKRKPDRRISPTLSGGTKICWQPTRGSSAMDQCTSRAASRSCLARAAIRMSTSRFTRRSVRCTAGITETGRQIRR